MDYLCTIIYEDAANADYKKVFGIDVAAGKTLGVLNAESRTALEQVLA